MQRRHTTTTTEFRLLTQTDEFNKLCHDMSGNCHAKTICKCNKNSGLLVFLYVYKYRSYCSVLKGPDN